jgi:hypothetical protein
LIRSDAERIDPMPVPAQSTCSNGHIIVCVVNWAICAKMTLDLLRELLLANATAVVYTLC